MNASAPTGSQRSRDDRLTLPAAMRERIVAHARAEAPRECCGLIAGEGGALVELIPLTNDAPGIDVYRIDDAELYRVYRDLDGRGQEIAAIYHSHPTSAAYPSAADVDLALWPDACYLICLIADVDRPDLRGFRIVDR